MKIQLSVIGKTDSDFIQQGLNEYCSRLKHYLPLDLEILPDIKNTKNLSSGQ
ncbi:MAG: 23S rRNA (pseudouridine(1915)-N(3))-methyltransferase RlmH, partial [Candidatus Symbiothrix sp.]|nr:23S rRNA (pseudouridine(1915)-N(3))-methyltransferase RlmH [Candidatus Symbiothrix sp.]